MERDSVTPAELLQAAFDKLPGELREALCLVRVERLAYEDAAVRMGISVKQLERCVALALVRLDRDVERMKWHEWRRWS